MADCRRPKHGNQPHRQIERSVPYATMRLLDMQFPCARRFYLPADAVIDDGGGDYERPNLMKAVASRTVIFVAIPIFAALVQTSTTIAQVIGGTVGEPSADDSNRSEIPDIVVTARKTNERLQDTPMSVAVITADAIEKTGATTLEDLGRATPGMAIVSAAPGQNQIILRGLSGNNTVGFYLDDTPLSIGIGNAVQLTDFDRSEEH